MHYLASRYYSITKASSFKTEVVFLKQIYGYRYLPRNATEVYLKYKHVYDKYLDRMLSIINNRMCDLKRRVIFISKKML